MFDTPDGGYGVPYSNTFAQLFLTAIVAGIARATLRDATALAMSGTDAIFGMPTKWALGYSIGRLGSSSDDASTSFGVGGAGGSFAYGDTASGVACAVTKNRLTPDFNSATKIVGIVTEALGDS